jgi:hypothetical protein
MDTNHQGKSVIPTRKLAEKVELVVSWEEGDCRNGSLLNKIILINGAILVKITKRMPPVMEDHNYYEQQGYPRGYEPPWTAEDECKEVIGWNPLDPVADDETLQDAEDHLRCLVRDEQQRE